MSILCVKIKYDRGEGMKNNIFTYVVVLIIALLIVFLVVLNLLKRRRRNFYKKTLDNLEVQKNLVGSIPISLELSKVEPLIKNGELEEKYNNWDNRLSVIKNEMLPKIDDMLIELDTFFDKKDYSNCDIRISKVELEIYKVREFAENLLEQIKEITSSDEKYRSIIIKLKTKYRKINGEYQKHKNLYDEMQDAVSLQLENIEKRFLDFEKYMENNEYNEVVHIVKALKNMIDSMEIIVNETPDLVLMAKQLVPQKIKEIQGIAKQMEEEGYSLEYLNIDYNIEESNKNIGKILDRIRVLNLDDCMFELKTILDYLDSLFVDFEKETLSRKAYEEIESGFSKKIEKTNKVVSEVMEQLDSINNMYDMKEEDAEAIREENKALIVINDDYKKMLAKLENKSNPYSELHKEIDELTVRLKKVTEDLDLSLKSLGNMYDDEQRAREQLNEIEKFLKASKLIIRNYKLPVVSDKYFIELNEANEAISEVIKELSKKPIVIKTLNTRVDTARDLVLKLYNTANSMAKLASLAENTVVYANRYRNYYEDIDKFLNKSEKFYFKGKYKEAFMQAVKAISIVDSDTYNTLMMIYEKNSI